MQLHIFSSYWTYFTALCTLNAACVLFFLIHIFLSLIINPCHLPYINELLTFSAICHIILPLAVIRKTLMFFPCCYISRSLIFVELWTYAAKIQNLNLAIRIICTFFFIFFCYVSYLATYLSILDIHPISVYVLPLLPL